MKSNVDIVITYVNPNDEVWQRDAERLGVIGNDSSRGNKRFCDDGVLELCLQSIKKFCKFYDNIYLVVSSKSQVPDYAKGLVKVIEHKDFIPQEYLPCFSSCTIECFFPFLPIENDRFLYFNDDVLLTREIKEGLFFKGENPISTVGIIKKRKFSENITTINAYNLITREIQKTFAVKSLHGVSCFNKKHLKECWDRYKKDLLKTIHPLGRTKDDVSQYVYSFYDFCYHFAGHSALKCASLYDMSRYKRFNWNSLGNYDCICLNTVERGDIQEYINKVKEYLYG